MDKKKAAFFAILITFLIFVLSAAIGFWTYLVIHNESVAVVEDFDEMTDYEDDVYEDSEGKDDEDSEDTASAVAEETKEYKDEIETDAVEALEAEAVEEAAPKSSLNSGNFNPNNFTHQFRDFIFEDSYVREITDSELEHLSSWELRIARNEIYARYGKQFKTQGIAAYFDALPWYSGTSQNIGDEKLNDVEKANVKRIIEYENMIGNLESLDLAGLYKGYDNDTEISISIYTDEDNDYFGEAVGIFRGNILNPYTGEIDENLEGGVYYNAPGCYTLSDLETYSYEVSFVRDESGKIGIVLMEYCRPICMLKCIEHYES